MTIKDKTEVKRPRVSLSKARKEGRLQEFIDEHSSDPIGDLDRLDAVVKGPSREIGKATRPASSQDASDD